MIGIGAVMGDMIGAPYEFDRGNKTKDFGPLFNKYSDYTDDSVMTVAVAEALINSLGKSDKAIKTELVKSMKKWGRRYPNAGYGGKFFIWLFTEGSKPYGSFGNGSAMRVSSAGWLFDTLEETRHAARLTAEVTHNHPEGIKGAEATVSAIFLARNGSSKEEIKNYIIKEFEYDLSRTCDEIRPGYFHIETCQQTVPEAITAFMEGTSFEDVIRTAVSLGGDCDTLTCIAGSIAEAFYGIPDELTEECIKRLPEDMLKVLIHLKGHIMCTVTNPRFRNSYLTGNKIIELTIEKYHKDKSNAENAFVVFAAIRERMYEDGHFMFPLVPDDSITGAAVKMENGELFQVVITSPEEYKKGRHIHVLPDSIENLLKKCLNSEVAGCIINPWGEKPFVLPNNIIKEIILAEDDEGGLIPDEPITAELLEGGSFLKRALAIYNRTPSQMNMIRLKKILRDSWVVIPCRSVMSDTDLEMVNKAIKDADEKSESLVGKELHLNDNIRMIPDILEKDNKFYFPVFTSEKEMGKYGERFSKLEKHFLEAVILAKNNKKNVEGIVINAFSAPVIINRELFEEIMKMESALEVQDEE